MHLHLRALGLLRERGLSEMVEEAVAQWLDQQRRQPVAAVAAAGGPPQA
jgi:hypothetical protein